MNAIPRVIDDEAKPLVLEPANDDVEDCAPKRRYRPTYTVRIVPSTNAEHIANARKRVVAILAGLRDVRCPSVAETTEGLSQEALEVPTHDPISS